MPLDIMLTVAVTAIVQSLFGAGVLLFGTPLLLLFGYEFVNVLVVLLPISLAINLLQIVKHYIHIDFTFYRKVLLLTLPPIAVFLFMITHIRINIGIVVGPFLLLIAMKEFSAAATRMIDRMMRHETLYFIAMGIVHGVSNLGGSLLTAIVHHKNYEKDVARVTVAAAYGTFAAVQLLTLWVFSRQQIDVPLHDDIIYLTIGALIFIVTDESYYAQIERDKYRRIFAGFLALSGLVLLLKTFN
ncbi:MAG: hypothetical protein ACU837_10885 [Gammaproteobacteria bacterium]